MIVTKNHSSKTSDRLPTQKKPRSRKQKTNPTENPTHLKFTCVTRESVEPTPGDMTCEAQHSESFLSNVQDVERMNLVLTSIGCTIRHIRDVHDQSEPMNRPPGLFAGSVVPDLDIPEYCKRLSKYFQCSASAFVTAMVYIDRFTTITSVTINRFTVHRLLSISLTIAVKFLEDVHFSNGYYARVSGLGITEFCRLEFEMITVMGFGLTISQLEFGAYLQELLGHPLKCTGCDPEKSERQNSRPSKKVRPG